MVCHYEICDGASYHIRCGITHNFMQHYACRTKHDIITWNCIMCHQLIYAITLRSACSKRYDETLCCRYDKYDAKQYVTWWNITYGVTLRTMCATIWVVRL